MEQNQGAREKAMELKPLVFAHTGETSLVTSSAGDTGQRPERNETGPSFHPGQHSALNGSWPKSSESAGSWEGLSLQGKNSQALRVC